MAHRDEITKYANDALKLHQYQDYGPMGLQFAGKEDVKKICSAVSISKNVIERTADAGGDILLVHHGMFWNNESRVLDERVGGRLELLEKYNISVLAYHLALDAHPKYGNNILLARNLGLGKLHRWQEIGYSGEFGVAKPCNKFAGDVLRKLGHSEYESYLAVHAHGDYAKKVAVIAGGAAHYVVQAHRDGFDTFVTGEPSEPSIYLAQDLGMNFFAFGHDKTERSGVQALGRQISKRFKIGHEFLPVENPI